MSDKQEVPRVTCKDLLRRDIAEIGAVMSEMRDNFGSLRAMEAATGIPKSTLQHVTEQHHVYKGSGLGTETLRKFRHLAGGDTILGPKLQVALDQYVARKRAGLYGHAK